MGRRDGGSCRCVVLLSLLGYIVADEQCKPLASMWKEYNLDLLSPTKVVIPESPSSRRELSPLNICQPDIDTTCCTPAIESNFLAYSKQTLQEELSARIAPIQSTVNKITSTLTTIVREEFVKSQNHTVTSIISNSSKPPTKLRRHIRELVRKFYVDISSDIDDVKGEITRFHRYEKAKSPTTRFRESQQYQTHIRHSIQKLLLDIHKSSVESLVNEHFPKQSSCIKSSIENYHRNSVERIEQLAITMTAKLEPTINNFKILHNLLALADQLLTTAQTIDFDYACTSAYSKMVFCSACGSLDNFRDLGGSRQKYRACDWFCFNVLRGCLQPTYHLHGRWKKLLDQLIPKGQKLGHAHRNYQTGLEYVSKEIQNEIKNGYERAAELTIKITSKCKRRKALKRSPSIATPDMEPAMVVGDGILGKQQGFVSGSEFLAVDSSLIDVDTRRTIERPIRSSRRRDGYRESVGKRWEDQELYYKGAEQQVGMRNTEVEETDDNNYEDYTNYDDNSEYSFADTQDSPFDFRANYHAPPQIVKMLNAIEQDVNNEDLFYSLPDGICDGNDLISVAPRPTIAPDYDGQTNQPDFDYCWNGHNVTTNALHRDSTINPSAVIIAQKSNPEVKRTDTTIPPHIASYFEEFKERFKVINYFKQDLNTYEDTLKKISPGKGSQEYEGSGSTLEGSGAQPDNDPSTAHNTKLDSQVACGDDEDMCSNQPKATTVTDPVRKPTEISTVPNLQAKELEFRNQPSSCGLLQTTTLVLIGAFLLT